LESLWDFFADIPDPGRAQGPRHRLATLSAIAAAASLFGMNGYLAIRDWAESPGQKARRRFCFLCENGRYVIRSLFTNEMKTAIALLQWNTGACRPSKGPRRKRGPLEHRK